MNITADTNNELTVNETRLHLSGYRVIQRSPDRAWDGCQLRRLSPRQSVSIKHGLRTGYKIRTRYKTRTGKYGLGIKHELGIKRRLWDADWV